MDRPLPARHLAFALCEVIFVLTLARWRYGTAMHVLGVVSGALVAVGIADLVQRRSTLRRNYPLLSHIRFFFETVRPMLRQYIVERAEPDRQPRFPQRGGWAAMHAAVLGQRVQHLGDE